MLELLNYGEDGPFGYGYNDACTAFANGESAMYTIGSYAIPHTLTMDEPTSKLACGNIASTANVEVSKWTGELPDVSVYREPRIVR